MYKLEPIVDVRFRPEIPVPFCMYSLPPISQMLDPSVFNQRSSSDKESSTEPRKPDELDEILERQKVLLEKLNLLRNRLDDLRSPQPLQTTTQLGAVERGQHAICAKPPQSGAQGTTIVLRCSPSRPPYAVLDILDILGEQYAVRLVAHAHSSVRVNTTLEALTKKLTEKPVVGGKPNLNVTLLWFDLAGDCDFLVKPLEQRRVRGEANVARHLYRLLPGNDYEKDPGTASSIDEKIDNLESHFLWKGKAGGEAVALAKEITADRSANRLVSLLAKSFLRNTKC